MSLPSFLISVIPPFDAKNLDALTRIGELFKNSLPVKPLTSILLGTPSTQISKSPYLHIYANPYIL